MVLRYISLSFRFFIVLWDNVLFSCKKCDFNFMVLEKLLSECMDCDFKLKYFKFTVIKEVEMLPFQCSDCGFREVMNTVLCKSYFLRRPPG